MSEELLDQQQSANGQTIIVREETKKSNGIGIAGFVLAIIALFIGWVPLIGWLVWLVGFVLSLIGVFKKPRGLAIAGLVISFIDVVMILFIFGGALIMA